MILRLTKTISVEQNKHPLKSVLFNFRDFLSEIMSNSSQNYLLNASNYTVYPMNIIDNLFDAERRIISIRMASDQLGVRPGLVSLMQEFSRRYRFNLATFFLGNKLPRIVQTWFSPNSSRCLRARRLHGFIHHLWQQRTSEAHRTLLLTAGRQIWRYRCNAAIDQRTAADRQSEKWS